MTLVSISGTTSWSPSRVGRRLKYRRHGRDCELGQVVPHLEREPGIPERRGEIIGCDEVTACGYVGPRHGENQGLSGAGGGVPKGESTAGAQNAARLAVQRRGLSAMFISMG